MRLPLWSLLAVARVVAKLPGLSSSTEQYANRRNFRTFAKGRRGAPRTVQRRMGMGNVQAPAGLRRATAIVASAMLSASRKLLAAYQAGRADSAGGPTTSGSE